MREAANRPKSPERRTLRWLLGGQLVLAVTLILIDLGPSIPPLFSPSYAPELDLPTQPGDQTRRYRPGNPANPGPGVDPDMPRRLLLEEAEVEGVAGLALRGAIAPGDGARIVAELEQKRPSLVTLDSPGGSVDDALQIGRTIRDIGAETRMIGRAVCLSACPYMFVGGSTRTVAESARIGVHQHSFGESRLLPAFVAVENIQRGQADVLEYLDAMDIDLRFMGPSMATPPDEIYILTPQELSNWGVVTG